jgi:hypothetical protein
MTVGMESPALTMIAEVDENSLALLVDERGLKLIVLRSGLNNCRESIVLVFLRITAFIKSKSARHVPVNGNILDGEGAEITELRLLRTSRVLECR